MRATLLVSVLLTALYSSADLKSLVVIHTNDFHGRIAEDGRYAGAARIAALVKKTRAENERVLVLDAGDAISGTPVSTMFQGVPIFEILNMVGYDAGAIGNHEFDHGYALIDRFREVANYPLLSANAFAPHGDLIGDAPALIRNIGGITVAIIGLITDFTPHIITPVGNEGISFATPRKMLAAMVSAMRPQVDLIVVVSHLGHEEEKQLASEVAGIDLIVGGHSHTLVEEPVRVGETWVVQANYYGTHVGYLELLVDTDEGGIDELEGGLIIAADLPPGDPEVKALVAAWESRVAEKVDVQIAAVSRSYNKIELQPMLERILAIATQTEFGYYNMGGIRDVITKGPVSARHIWNIEPFGNTLVTLTTDGATLKKIMQRENESHGRVDKIVDNETYTVGTNSFIGAQAKKVYGDKVTVSDKGVLVRDVLIDHIRANGI